MYFMLVTMTILSKNPFLSIFPKMKYYKILYFWYSKIFLRN